MNNWSLFFKLVYFTVKNRSPIVEIYLKEKKALDIGCGAGKLLREDSENFLGIDVNERVLKIAAEKKLRVLKASGCCLPFKDDEFDAVNCDNVIEHLLPEDAYKLLVEASRVLRRGGILILRTQMAYKEIWETFSHIRPYPPKAIEKLLHSELEGYLYEVEESLVKKLTIEKILYNGKYFKNNLLRNLSNTISFFTPLNRRGYTMILRK
ncbi:MAG: class I SAM-dependent methyltransferase [Candidatus Hodarchaeales archaeon]